MKTRNELFYDLETKKEWDLIIIGGGATGLGIALDAVTRKYSVLLVEQADFSKGTSSRSTKLVHGGVRYLAQGDIALVREASVERGLLQKNAPHLVKNQTFVIPIYTLWDKIQYTIGLKFYDWISGKLSLGSSKLISKKKAIKMLPGVKTKGLTGGVLYHDGQFDDSRLAINLVQSIIEQGGTAINYAQVIGLYKSDAGMVNGITLKDIETSKVYEIKGKAIVNATGVFVDGILKMDNPNAANTVIASQGIHLVLDRSFYPAGNALMIPKTSDGRVLFAVPWHNEVVVGTTDTLVGEPQLEPKALEKEVEFVLETASAFLEKKPSKKDVLSVFAGLRPLAAPKEGTKKTKEISRSHKIIISESNLFTMLGGKWTTFRKMGEDMVSTIEKRLGWLGRKSTSETFHIHGYKEQIDWSDPLYFYGSDEDSLLAKMNGTKGQWLSEELKIHEKQIEWAVEHEMARTIEDFLSRRTRALLLNARESMRIAPVVATKMAQLLGYDELWVKSEVDKFNAMAIQYILN